VQLDIAANDLPSNLNPDFIVHLSAETHVERSIHNPANFMMSNVFGTYSLLEYARAQSNLKKLIAFSTDEVFGPAEEIPFHEWSRHNPSNPYAATKSASENLAMAWEHLSSSR
jgi:dTDP-glucose 4,6-dehydratase